MSTTTTGTGKYELTYWPIRGLGSLARAALIYSDIPFTDNRTVDWYGEGKLLEKLSKEFPLINLPNLKLPSGEIISQSQAVLRHIARHGPLNPQNDTDANRVDEVIEHIRDIHTEKMKMSYGPHAKDNIEGFFAESVPYYYGTLEAFVAKNNTKFTATNYITIADIFLAEQFAGLEKLKKGLEWAAAFPHLTAIYHAVTTHDKLKAYYEAEKNTPHNNPQFAAWH